MPNDMILSKTIPRTAEKVLLTFMARPDGAVLLRSVELLTPPSRTRFSFKEDMTAAGVLAAGVAASIEKLLREALAHKGMLALPDFVITAKNLVLADCSVMIASAREEGEQIMVRFNRFWGNLLSIFAPNAPPLKGLTDEMDTRALEALEQAYMPLLDFAEHVGGLRDRGVLKEGDQNAEALIGIAERIRALKFYQVMTRRLAEKGVSEIEAPPFVHPLLSDLDDAEQNA